MNFLHIIFLFPIVTPPLTWLFQLEHLYVYDERGLSIVTPIYLMCLQIQKTHALYGLILWSVSGQNISECCSH